MACRTVWGCVVFVEPYRPMLQNRAFCCLSLTSVGSSSASLRYQNYGRIRARNFHSGRRIHLNCLQNESQSLSEDDDVQVPPQEAVLKAISEVSKAEGRVGQTTNVIIGGTVADDGTNKWLALDQKFNSYPTVREFTAIGTGGDDFVQAMVVAIESVIQKPIPEGRVKQKLSSRGKYVSVNIDPIQVSSSEQLPNVYDLETLTTLRIIEGRPMAKIPLYFPGPGCIQRHEER